jgi:hypothetical protein
VAAYTYEKELGILGFLEKACEGTTVKFFWTNTRANSAVINKRLGIKYVQGRYARGQDQLEIYLMKNFAKESSDWRQMFKKISAFVAALVAQGKISAGVRYYADTGESLPIAKPRQTAFEKELEELAAANAAVDVASTLSPDLQKLLVDLKSTLPKSKGTDEELMTALRAEDRGAQVANFSEALKDGNHILLPTQAWKSTGFARQAASTGVRVLRLDADSPLLALPLDTYKKLATDLGFTVTEDQQHVVPRMANIQPNPVTPSAAYASAISKLMKPTESPEERQLKDLDNPEKVLQQLEVRVSRGHVLGEDDTKLLNILRRVVNNNELSLLTMKKLQLSKVIEKQAAAYESTRQQEIDAVRKRHNPEDNRVASSVANQRNLLSDLTDAAVGKVIQIKKSGTYWTAVSINGVAILYT